MPYPRLQKAKIKKRNWWSKNKGIYERFVEWLGTEKEREAETGTHTESK